MRGHGNDIDAAVADLVRTVDHVARLACEVTRDETNHVLEQIRPLWHNGERSCVQDVVAGRFGSLDVAGAVPFGEGDELHTDVPAPPRVGGFCRGAMQA